jgi:hypothetical protein
MPLDAAPAEPTPPPKTEEEAEQDAEAAMMAAMGFSGFNTTQGQHVAGNSDKGAVGTTREPFDCDPKLPFLIDRRRTAQVSAVHESTWRVQQASPRHVLLCVTQLY